MKIYEYPKIGEKVFSEKLDSGLHVYLWPKKDYNQTHGLFTVEFGSADTKYNLPNQTLGPLQISSVKEYPQGVAHFLEHELFQKKYGDVTQKFTELGASTNAFTSHSQTSYLFSTTDNVKECLELLLNFVQDPYFTDELVEKERGIIEQEIKMFQDDHDWQLFAEMMKNLYPDSSLSQDIAGTIKSIQKIDAQMLYENYENFYRRGNMNVFVGGNFVPEEIMELIRENQQRNSNNSSKFSLKMMPPPKKVKAIESSIKYLNVARPKFMLTARNYFLFDNNSLTYVKHKMSIEIFLQMLFGETSSAWYKLYNMNFIDDSYSFNFNFERNIDFFEISGDSEEYERVTSDLTEVLEDYQINKSFSEKDFNFIKKQTIGTLISSLNNIGSLAKAFSSQTYREFPPFEAIEIVENLDFIEFQKIIDDFMKSADFSSVIVMRENRLF